MKIKKKTIVHGSPIFSRGPLSFYINLCYPGECRKMAPLKIPQNACEDDIRVLFFHVVLSTVDVERIHENLWLRSPKTD